MLKKFIVFLFALFLLFFPSKVSANEDFFVDVEAKYEISELGETSVVNTVTIENVNSNVYAESYTLNLQSIEPKNTRAIEAEQELTLEVEKKESIFSLTVHFTNAVVGKGEKRTFVINYDVDSFAERTGEVWEITIPRLVNEKAFRNYRVILSVPITFGETAYISPKTEQVRREETRVLYFFDKEAVAKTGITAGFGKFQVFSFILNYHLENPLAKSAITEIALPPDTAFQKLYYESLSPEPTAIVVDEDGNWLAKYKLKPRQRIDIKAIGVVQILASPRQFLTPSDKVLAANKKATEYWEVADENIQSLARQLQNPSAIYDFVTKSLTYDYERVRPNVARKGAKQALATSYSAICMEFTDAFVALTRAAGIPAREINGYAYTENPEIQPLSLVADVLHSWPEYWDGKLGVWVPVDPTWGATTGGVDYFNKLDLRHFTFVIHGQSSTKPYAPGSYKLGTNPQKDVFVNFGYLPEKRKSQPEVVAVTKKGLPLTSTKVAINIRNPGPSALYNLSPKVYFDNKVVKTDLIEILPPYGDYQMQTVIPFSLLGRKTPSEVKIEAGGSTAFVPTFKNQVIIYSLIIFSAVLSSITLWALAKNKKFKTKQIGEFIKGIRRWVKKRSENYAQKLAKTKPKQKEP